jgi:hypothetical protein
MRRSNFFYLMLGVLLLLGVGSYVYSSGRQPEIPNRIMFYNMGGNVLFSHKTHASEDGYALECHTCHHTWDEKDRSDPPRCTACHPKESETELKRADAMHKQCKGCHEDVGNSPVKCSECHVFY